MRNWKVFSKHMKTIIEKQDNLSKETSRRREKMKKEFSKEPVIKLFKNVDNYDQIRDQGSIQFSDLCEHNWVSFEGEAHVAYIPDEWLTGLSKLPRIVEYYLNPTVKTIQEKATHQILNAMVSTLKPKGVMVVIRAKHSCVCYRGVKKPSMTITSAVKGIFAEKDGGAREEFLTLLNKI